MPRNVYLEDIPLDEAERRFAALLAGHGGPRLTVAEQVPVADALGRVTARPHFALRSVPHYHAAAMDGIAVRAADTLGALETAPGVLRLGDEATWVDTGEPLPEGRDAVIMAEQVHERPDGTVEILASVAPWQHVRPMGEDIVATEMVLPANHRLTPPDLGALVAAGHLQVAVRRKPRVAILPTGSEIVAADDSASLKPGEIVDFNSVVLAAQVAEWGGAPTRFPPTPDVRAEILAMVQEAARSHDVVVINAGSSAGSEDFTVGIVREVGEVVVHGVALRPGHPLILGASSDGVPILGIPGYPVSAIVTSDLFLRPLVYALQGLPAPGHATVTAQITRKLLSPMGEDELVRVKLGEVSGRVIATPLSRGAGVIMSMVRADGLALLPRFSEGVHAGEAVQVRLLRPEQDLRKTVVAIGSHDLALDLLSNALATRSPGASLASSNVGSLGGLLALARGEAHLAGTHLLDEASGVYNQAAVQRYVPRRRTVLVTLAGRVQGLLVPRDNPLRLGSLADLALPGVRFVNRQRGSGTRVLLDYRLRLDGIDPTAIAGYEREQYTHLAVAADVASGAADVGLGILAAARALDLDFVPLFQERYDLAIPREHYDAPILAPLLEILRGEGFRAEVEALGGYDCQQMGMVAWEG
ncbi:MAG: molybdopterin biosynthesis protein [Chloroflexi bacterium]|nr:molybdopterin biosynthesis protein [Chloroflexota bacterium]